jgi:hypothetical protein
MARSKQVTKKVEKKAEAPLTTKKQNETPYQLDPAQVERAANALVAHMKKHKEEKETVGTKDLMADEDEAEESDQPIFLSVSTKKHVSNSNSLKPTKMSVCMLRLRRILLTDSRAVPCLTPSLRATPRSASSPRTRSAHTRTLLPRMHSLPHSANESAA